MTSRTLPRFAAGTTAALFLFAAASQAATLTVGPGKMYAQPANAAAAAHSGDTIQIYPGTYSGAVFTQSNLTIIGMSTGATITGTVKLGKGLFVIDGANTTVQNLTFKGATASAGNGAGIRLEAAGLKVVNSKFLNNQDGILTDNDRTHSLSVTGSTFTGNGSCSSSSGCAHAIYAGSIGSLSVTNSTFTDTKAGHHIKSRALTTTVTGNNISDGTTGTSSYLIDVPNGGIVTITGNTLEKGPKSTNSMTAIALGEEGATNPQGAMLIANNTFQNDFKKTQSFVWNKTGYAGLLLSGNVLKGYAVTTLFGPGTISKTAARNIGAASGQTFMASAAADPLSVPEPSSLALLAAALAGAGFFLRRRRAL